MLLLVLLLIPLLPGNAQPRPVNYPANSKAFEVISYGGSYTPGDTYSQCLDTVCSFLYKWTPRNGSELLVSYGHGDSVVWALSQCSNKTLDRDHCTACLTAARVRIDDYNTSFPVRGGAYWTTGINYECFLLYKSSPIDIVDPSVVITMSVTSPPLLPPRERVIYVPVPSTSTRASKLIFYVGAPVTVVCVAFVVVILLTECTERKTNSAVKLTERTRCIEYRELELATDGFSADEKLGEGGFGEVYKGVLSDGKVVAVKRLSLVSDQGTQEFLNELKVITEVQHKNLVEVIGYCAEDHHKLLVYEFLHNRSLDIALFDNTGVFLNWSTRYNIVIGVSSGLAYLHHEANVTIIHRDIKASNILLDRHLNARISDFGISKLSEGDRSCINGTKIAGTYGYIAPEYALRGRLTVRADVYSFGILALEIVAGRKCTEVNEKPLLERAWDLKLTDNLQDLVDKRLDSYDHAQVLRVIHIALLCTDGNENSRPKMSEVAAMLLGYAEVWPLKSRQSSGFLSH